MEALNSMIIRDKKCDLFRGLKIGVGEQTEEITHLFFADNAIFFSDLAHFRVYAPSSWQNVCKRDRIKLWKDQ